MIYKTQKLQRVLKVLGWENTPENVLKFSLTMDQFPEESRKIIEIRWGLIDNTKACKSYKELDQKLGINNSRDVYMKVLNEVRNYHDARILIDSEQFSLDMAASLARLAMVVLGNNNLRIASIDGKILLELLTETITSREATVITMLFGLDGINSPKTIKQVALELNTTQDRIKKIQANTIRKLRNRTRVGLFYPAMRTGLEMSQITFSVILKTVNVLRLTSIDDFFKLSYVDLKNATNLSEEEITKIKEIRELVGYPL